MASQGKIMGSVTSAVRFITEQVQASIAEKRKELELTDEQARKLNVLVEASVQKAYSRSMNSIMNTIDG